MNFVYKVSPSALPISPSDGTMRIIRVRLTLNILQSNTFLGLICGIYKFFVRNYNFLLKKFGSLKIITYFCIQ